MDLDEKIDRLKILQAQVGVTEEELGRLQKIMRDDNDRLEEMNKHLKKLCGTVNLLVNTTFEARLTARGSPTITSAPTGAIADTTRGLAVQSFVTSSAITESAHVGGSIYVPIFSDSMFWNFRGDNAIFIGPVFKYGFQSIPDTVTVDGKSFVSRDLFATYTFGVRFGHLSLNRQQNIAPEVVSYIDYSWNTYETLPHLKNVPGVGLDKRRYKRWSLKGRMKIPFLPFRAGFDMVRKIDEKDPPDQLRFIFATYFEIGKLFRGLVVPQ